MAGGAETPNIAALPAIARLGACKSARGPDADRRVKLLIQFAVEGSLSGAYSHSGREAGGPNIGCTRCGTCYEIEMSLKHKPTSSPTTFPVRVLCTFLIVTLSGMRYLI